MEFCFIDNNKRLERRTQKIIRSHALNGKNLGKVIHSRGHKHRKDQKVGTSNHVIKSGNGRQLVLVTGAEVDAPELKIVDPTATPSLLNHFCGAEYSFFTFPMEVTPSIRYLFYEFHYAVCEELYPQVFCRQSSQTGGAWFENLTADPCVVHCVLAMTAAYMSLERGRSVNDKAASTWHCSQAIRLLRNNLDTTFGPLSPGVIAVVISLAIHAKLRGALNESRNHLLGLKRILELHPGGLAAIRLRAPELGNKILRMDAEISLLSGKETIFGSQTRPATLYVIQPADQVSAVPEPFNEACMVMQYAMSDVLALCRYAGRSQLDAFQYLDMVTEIFHRLVDFAPIGCSRPARLEDDICQLSLIAFMSTILYRIHYKVVVYNVLVSKLIWERLSNSEDQKDVGSRYQTTQLRLWLLFVYALSTPEYKQGCYLNPSVAREVRAVAKALDLRSWEDAQALLIVYPWTSAFHDIPGKKLWQSAVQP